MNNILFMLMYLLHARRPYRSGEIAAAKKTDKDEEKAKVVASVWGSVVDSDPHGSGTFAYIWIRNYCSGSSKI